MFKPLLLTLIIFLAKDTCAKAAWRPQGSWYALHSSPTLLGASSKLSGPAQELKLSKMKVAGLGSQQAGLAKANEGTGAHIKELPAWKGYEYPDHKRASHNQQRRRPVLYIPPLTGTELYAKLKHKTSSPRWWCSTDADWFRLWLDPRILLPGQFPCYADNLRLIHDCASGLSSPPPGVTVRQANASYITPAAGNGSSGNGGPGWGPIRSRLLALGWSSHDLGVAHYDWRCGPVDWMAPGGDFHALMTQIEAAVAAAGGQRLVAVGHSLGATYFNTFLTHYVTQEWKDKHIHAHVSISGVWAGTAVSAWDVLAGRLEGFESLLDRPSVLTVMRGLPSLVWTMPAPPPEGDHGTAPMQQQQQRHPGAGAGVGADDGINVHHHNEHNDEVPICGGQQEVHHGNGGSGNSGSGSSGSGSSGNGSSGNGGMGETWRAGEGSGNGVGSGSRSLGRQLQSHSGGGSGDRKSSIQRRATRVRQLITQSQAIFLPSQPSTRSALQSAHWSLTPAPSMHAAAQDQRHQDAAPAVGSFAAAAHAPTPASGIPTADPVVITNNGQGRAYRASQLADALQDVGATQAAAFWHANRKYMQQGAPNVTVFCFYSYGLKTASQITFFRSDYSDPSPEVVSVDGDVTVPLHSLECKRWRAAQAAPVFSAAYYGLVHAQLTMLPEAMDDIVQAIAS